jgi:hypothetical protein
MSPHGIFWPFAVRGQPSVEPMKTAEVITPSRVTLKPKCYVFVCAGCNLLAMSERSDALTCSARCRVKAHRNGNLRRIRKITAGADVPPGMYVQCQAVLRLCPHLAQIWPDGRRFSLEDTRAEVWEAFCRVLGLGG